MFRQLVVLVRFLIGWLWTILVAGGACVCSIRPQWMWLNFSKPWARNVLRIIGIELHIVGKENLVGPAVFISNHESLIDVVFMPAILPRTVKFVAKKELTRVPLWGWAFANGGGLMIDRSDPRGAIAAIKDGLDRMPKDWSVAVFPEGTRSADGKLGPFKKGAFHIAMQRGLPVVPVGFSGARDVIPKHAWLARAGRVFVTVGRPIPTDSWSLETIEQHVAEARTRIVECRAKSQRRRQEHFASLAEQIPEKVSA